MSGLEFFRAWSLGEVTPPMAETLGFDLAEFGEGTVEITCKPEEFHYNPYGTAHGGLAATLIDTATGCAVHTTLQAGTGYATTNLSISYVRPATVDSQILRCRGELVSLGRRVAMADGILTDGSGKLLARGSATCLII